MVHKGFLFPLPPTCSCVCTTQNKSIRLFASCSVCKASISVSVPACACALLFPSPRGTLLCTQECIHTWVARVWCLVWHVQKAHFTECLLGLGGFCRVRECHGIIPNVLPLLLMKNDQKMFTKHNFFFINVSNLLECFNWLHY